MLVYRSAAVSLSPVVRGGLGRDLREFYGFSERTAERGYLELRRAKLLREKTILVPEARHPLGRREEWHRALAFPYSTDHRETLRKAAKAASDAMGNSV